MGAPGLQDVEREAGEIVVPLSIGGVGEPDLEDLPLCRKRGRDGGLNRGGIDPRQREDCMAIGPAAVFVRGGNRVPRPGLQRVAQVASVGGDGDVTPYQAPIRGDTRDLVGDPVGDGDREDRHPIGGGVNAEISGAQRGVGGDLEV